MAQLFEYCWYAGAIFALIGTVWLFLALRRRPVKSAMAPLGLLVLAAALILGPAWISRSLAVNLGPRETLVDGERHVMLTGWDGESYELLSTKPDTVVLQMANASVDDRTLDFLSDMHQLRELDLNDSSVSDAGLAKLARLPTLRTLRLRGTRITDAGFREHLLPLPALEQLDLRQTAVGVETVEQWKSEKTSRKAFH